MADYDVVIEIPKGSRNKYEVDHETGRVYLDRVLFTASSTRPTTATSRTRSASTATRVDVLVLLEYPLFPGVGVKVRPVGVFNMTDDGGSDAKVIAVPAQGPALGAHPGHHDIPEYTRKEIEHFFEHYKDLEPGKWVKTEGWGDAAEAEAHHPEGDRGVPRSLSIERMPRARDIRPRRRGRAWRLAPFSRLWCGQPRPTPRADMNGIGLMRAEPW